MDRMLIIPDVVPLFSESMDAIFDKSPVVKDVDEEYDKVPAVFTTIKDWISCTNLHCMNCCLQYTTVPVPMVNNASCNKTTQVMSYKVIGLCCSFECLLNAIITTYQSRDTRWEVMTCAGNVAREFGVDIDTITAALGRQYLKQFGGNMTTKQYRSKLNFIKEKPTL